MIHLSKLIGLRRLYIFRVNESLNRGNIVQMNIDGFNYVVVEWNFPFILRYDETPLSENSIPVIIEKASITLLDGRVILSDEINSSKLNASYKFKL